MTVAFVAVALSSPLSCAAHAQQALDSLGAAEESRRTCASAAAVVEPSAGRSGQTLINALRRVQSCREDGPVALARRWSSPPRDSGELRVLAGVTAQVRDTRLLDAVIGATRNTTLSIEARLESLGVLVTAHDSTHYAVIPSAPTGPGERLREYVRIGTSPDPVSFRGSVPLVDSVARPRILGVLQELAAGEAEVRLRMTAAYLLAFLSTAK